MLDGEYVKKDGQFVREGKGRSIDGPEEYVGDWYDDQMHGKGK